MSYCVYILYSKFKDRLYIGQTQDLEARLEKHNRGYVRSTKYGSPWLVLAVISCSSRAAAMKYERQLKNLKSRKRVGQKLLKLMDDERSVGPEFYQIFDLG
jgi:putative endonuclease